MTPNFVDMYHGDNNEMLPDFSKLKSDGIILVALKATQGSSYVDPTFLVRAVAADRAGLPVIAYHFGDGTRVATQLANFDKVLQALDGKMSYLPVWSCLDFETLRPQMSVASAVSFVEQITAPILYGSDLVRENGKAFQGVMPWLWLAEYGPKENVPAPWTKAQTIGWQYSERGSLGGIAGHVDLNVTGWTSDQLKQNWGKPCSTASSKTPLPTSSGG